MKRGNYGIPRCSKALVLFLALVLIVVALIGTTVAWLMDTEEATNTFTVAELFKEPSSQFTLWEHEAVDEDENDLIDGQYVLDLTKEVAGNSYLIVPGVNIPKDPTVDIVDLEGNGYLYIKVIGNLANGLDYAVDDTYWEPLSADYPNIWVYKGEHAVNHVIQASDSNKVSFTVTILKENQIVVPKDYSSNANGNLTFYAYMAQASFNGANAAEAWANTFATTP